jgi:hypothetical protein
VRLDEDDTSLDADLVGFIADAAAWVEQYTGHILVARDVIERFSSFDRLGLRAWPIKSDAVVGIGYLPTNAAASNLYGARIASSARPAVVVPASGTWWPSCASSVTVLVRAGYEDDDEIPRNFRRAMLILISAYESDREGGDILAKAEAAARRLCRDYRLHKL